MAVLTSQKINTYYDQFKSIDVIFSKEIVQVTGLVPQQVYIKCGSDIWPCVVYSTSFQGAKVAANIKSGILTQLRHTNNVVSLRFFFKNSDNEPLAFFVSARSTGYVPYGASEDIGLFTLQFTQRPSDDLIEIVGRLLDANVNSTRRRDERVLVTVECQRKLGLVSKETAAFIQGVPRRCILRDLSFSGAKIIIMGVAKFLEGRDASLRLDFYDPRESLLVKGRFTRSEMVEGRKELVALALLFDDSQTPMSYKLRLSDYLNQIRTTGDSSIQKLLHTGPENPEGNTTGEAGYG